MPIKQLINQSLLHKTKQVRAGLMLITHTIQILFRHVVHYKCKLLTYLLTYLISFQLDQQLLR